MRKAATSLPVVLVVLVMNLQATGQGMIVIAHRGASGYLPEHTLPAKALAYGMGADYIEQDVVLTKDDRPIVLHDIHLDTVTDVAIKYPERRRQDGRYYAIDLTLAEIKQLNAHERVSHETHDPVYIERFPFGKSAFRVPTLAEEIELIQGLNQSTGRQVGIYPEIKKPAWHRQEGKDISKIVLRVLAEYGYDGPDDAIYLQCFDPVETRRIREELHCQLKLIQLIANNDWEESPADFDSLRTEAGIKQIAEYADGIGPSISHILEPVDHSDGFQLTELVRWAHANDLQVHPFTLRADALPDFVTSMEELMAILADQVSVDGVFTDFPDRAREFLISR